MQYFKLSVFEIMRVHCILRAVKKNCLHHAILFSFLYFYVMLFPLRKPTNIIAINVMPIAHCSNPRFISFFFFFFFFVVQQNFFLFGCVCISNSFTVKELSDYSLHSSPLQQVFMK